MNQPKRQSFAGRIRTILKEIETRIWSGESHESILESINKEGFNATIATFRSELMRARKGAKVSSGSGKITGTVEKNNENSGVTRAQPEKESQANPVRIADLISEDRPEAPPARNAVETPRQRRERLAAKFVADDSVSNSLQRMLDKGKK